MKRLIRNTILINLTIFLLINVIQSIGQSQPIAAAITELHLTDCNSDCWIGIKPDITQINDGIAIFRSVFPQNDGPLLIPRSDPKGKVLAILYTNEPPSDLITAIDLIPLTDYDSEVMPQVGDIILIWGIPTCVMVSPKNNWIVYHKMEHEISISIDNFDMRQKINALEFTHWHSTQFYGCENHGKSWIGFASNQRYLAQVK